MLIEDRINLRTSPERKKYIAKAASYCGTTLSAFLLDSAEERAREVMREQTQIQFCAKDWQAFEKILDEAETKSRPKLKKLIEDNEDHLV